MKNTAAFIMPCKIAGTERELRFLSESVESIKSQTDRDWILIIVDDFSNDPKVLCAMDEIEKDLKDKVHVIHLEENVGTGNARNVGIRYAHELGVPFIVFNDAYDIAHPRRLELVREKFRDESVNVVYLSFDVIDENGTVTPEEKISFSILEIINGHNNRVVEGEDAWIPISTEKNYTNLTSCTAVRTDLAFEEPFPPLSVSEDAHTWLRYGAHPGKFAFIREVKNRYRICSKVESRSRGLNADFYQKKSAADSDGFEKAMAISESFGRIRKEDENRIRVAFLVREALSMVYGDSDDTAGKLLASAAAISKEDTLGRIDRLDCKENFKDRLRALVR